jgi:copper transport protein
VRRFSQLALAAVALIVVTGVLRAVPEVGSLAGLVSRSFGIALLVKTGLFAVLMALAWRNRYRLVPRIERPLAIRWLRRSVRSEVAVAAVVLVAPAVLSGLPPGSDVQAARQAPGSRSVVVTGSDFATTARVRLTVSPGTVGRNRFQVQVRRYDTASPLPARSVRLEFSLPSNPKSAPTCRSTASGRSMSLSRRPPQVPTSRCWYAPGNRPSLS